MPKKAKRHEKMPKFYWELEPWILKSNHMRLLSFFWYCSDIGCRCWNYRLAKMFQVSPRTIRRWIKRLHELEFIYINYPSTRHRTIYRRKFYRIGDYHKYKGRPPEAMRQFLADRRKTHTRPKMAYINTPSEDNKLESAYYPPTREDAESSANAADESIASDAGGLSGSRGKTKVVHDIVSEYLNTLHDQERSSGNVQASKDTQGDRLSTSQDEETEPTRGKDGV